MQNPCIWLKYGYEPRLHVNENAQAALPSVCKVLPDLLVENVTGLVKAGSTRGKAEDGCLLSVTEQGNAH